LKRARKSKVSLLLRNPKVSLLRRASAFSIFFLLSFSRKKFMQEDDYSQ
jgi:hypothetical protein